MHEEVFIENFLMHYGVKGMKWGVRKDRELSGLSSVSGTTAKGSTKRESKTTFQSGSSFRKNESLSRSDMSLDELKSEVIRQINPDFGKYIGTTTNCRRCTFSYEMRRRGNDVAVTSRNDNFGENSVEVYNVLYQDKRKKKLSDEDYNVGARLHGGNNSWLNPNAPEHIRKITEIGIRGGENSIPVEIRSTRMNQYPAYMRNTMRNVVGPLNAQQAFNALGSQPNGARGELVYTWQAGGAHSVSWEIVKGKPVIIDNQSGQTYSNVQELSSVTRNVVKMGYTRLDNKKIDEKYLKKWMRDA